jgi:hypothetical protein
MVTPSPDKLVEAGASILARFGYQPFTGEEENWSGVWKLLKSDFTTQKRPWVVDFDGLTPSQKEAAKIYMRRRLIADRLFEECRQAQADLYQGIGTELVERYSIAREAYEDSVEDFGSAREKLDSMLP